jgi:hypothetical protein
VRVASIKQVLQAGKETGQQARSAEHAVCQVPTDRPTDGESVTATTPESGTPVESY